MEFESFFEQQKDRKLINTRNRARDLLLKIETEKKQCITKNDFEFVPKFATTNILPPNIFVHIDLDMFYVQCETQKNPNLINLPVAVGSYDMLCTSNYIARKLGIKAGLPGYKAKQICPELIIVPCNFHLYISKSEEVMSTLSLFDPSLGIYGMDEACLTISEKNFGPISRIAWNICNDLYPVINKYLTLEKLTCLKDIEFNCYCYSCVDLITEAIRSVVLIRTGLTASAGISCTKGLAKLTCGINKPNGQYLLDRNYQDFLRVRNIGELCGIGSATKETLKVLGIKTVHHLKTALPLIKDAFKEKTYHSLCMFAHGFIHWDFKSDYETKSIGRERSFVVNGFSETTDLLYHISKSIYSELIQSNLQFGCVTLTLRLASYKRVTRQCSVLGKTLSDIFISGVGLLKEYGNGYYRGIGLRISKLLSRKRIIESGKSTTIVQIKTIDRMCPICGQEYFTESQICFVNHVESCISIPRQVKKNGIYRYIKRAL